MAHWVPGYSKILFLVYLCQHATHSAEVFPTSFNSSASYYVTSSAANFSNNEINCASNTSNCYILCEYATSDCSYLTVNASKTEHLYITCSQQSSCEQLQIVSGPNSTVEINCLYISSCKYAYFQVSNTKNVNLICNNSATSTGSSNAACYRAKTSASHSINTHLTCGRYDCYYLRFDITYLQSKALFQFDSFGAYYATINAGKIQNNLSLPCIQDNSCKLLQIFCPDLSYCNIDCGANYNGCWDAGIHFDHPKYLNMDCGTGLGNEICHSSDTDCTIGGGLGYRPLPDESVTYFFNCETVGCCPSWNSITLCDAFIDNEHCIINCTISDNCDNAVIDAVSIAAINNITINKLTLNCDSCEDSIVQCPVVECNINCKDCSDSSFVTSNSINLNVICNGDCARINIRAQNVDTLNFECRSGSCHGTDFYNLYSINNLNILCTDGCTALDIKEAYNINNFHLQCINESSCWSSGIDIKEVSNVNIECLSYVSCFSGDYYFYNLSNTINVTCSNLQRNKVVSIANGACHEAKLYVFNSVNSNVVSNSICDSEDCDETYFEFSNVETAYLTCTNYRSCYTVEWHVEHTSEAFLQCNGANACDYMDLYAPYSISTRQSLHVACYGHDESCNGVRLYVVTNFMPNFLELNCTNNTNSHCTGTNFDGITIQCDDNRYSNKYNWLVDPPTKFVTTYSNNKFGCYSNKCCPWMYPEIIACVPGNIECIIDCSQDSNNCINKYINFNPYNSNLTSLTVKCNTYQSCSWAVVMCPNKEPGICNIECTADGSCEYLRVEYGDNSFNKVNMSCHNAQSGVVNICHDLQLYGYDAENINFECNKALCRDVTIHALLASNVNVDCISTGSDSTCQFLKINGYNVSSNVNINCIGYRACWYPQFDFFFANNIMINARQDNSWFYGDVAAFYASYLTINCSSEKYETACVSPTWYLPSTATGYATINCFGTGCQRLNIFETDGSWDHITFNYNECGQCNGFDCLADINIECIRTASSTFFYSQYENMTDIRSNICTKNQTCACNAIRNQFIANHINDNTNSQCLLAPTYSPTRSPTPSPSPAPTKPPTKFPTETPTITPSKNPTSSPSYMPSISPSYPTNEPTVQPTISPTSFPSNQPSIPPTMSPSKAILPTKRWTAIPTNGNGFDGSDNQSSNESGKYMWLGVGAAIVGIILVGLLVFCCFCRNKNKTYVPSEKMKTMNQAQQIQPVPVQQVQQPMIVQLVQVPVIQNNNNQQPNETAGAQLMQMHQYMNNENIKYNGHGEGGGNNVNEQQYTLQ